MPIKQQEATSCRCKAMTKAGGPCAAPAIKGGQYCSLHSSPGRAAELGRKGGLRNRHTYEQATEHAAPPESAADVKRMLAETMADVKAGRMDPKVANTVAYVGTVLLRAYQADAAPAADTPTQPYVPLIYRSLIYRDGRKHEANDVIDLETGERVRLPAAEVPCALPSHPPSAAPPEIPRPREEIELEILDY